jgi:hypothetical protein
LWPPRSTSTGWLLVALSSRLWAEREVVVPRTLTKRTVHPVAGPLELDGEILAATDHEHRLLIYTTAPGTRSAEGLKRLRAG